MRFPRASVPPGRASSQPGDDSENYGRAADHIPRNHTRKIAELRQQRTACHVYALGGQFIAQPVDPAQAWDALQRYSAKLIDDGDGTVRPRVPCLLVHCCRRQFKKSWISGPASVLAGA